MVEGASLNAMDLVYENMVASVATAIVLLFLSYFLLFWGTSRPAGGSGGGAGEETELDAKDDEDEDEDEDENDEDEDEEDEDGDDDEKK